MVKTARLSLTIVGLAVLLTVVGCGTGPQTTSTSSAKATAPAESVFELDSANAIENDVTSAGGGGVAVKPTDDSVVRIAFPKDALKADATVVATPLNAPPVDDAAILAAGFMVTDKATGEGPALSAPAFITYTVAGKLPEDATLVRYADDGTSFVPVATSRETNDEATALTAVVDGFSAYGIANGSGASGSGAGSGSGDSQTDAPGGGKVSDYNWVIYVNDSHTFSDLMSQSLKLDLKATNTSGKLTGNYAGKATSSTKGQVSGAKGEAKNVGSAKGTIKLHMTGFIEDPLAPLTDKDQPDPLASLTPEDDALAPLTPSEPKDDEKLAPLEPKKQDPPKPPNGNADLQGTGTITMAGQGTATATAKGVSKSVGHGGSDSLPVTVFVSGPTVTLYCDFPGDLGRATFTGYIIGQGKK